MTRWLLLGLGVLVVWIIARTQSRRAFVNGPNRKAHLDQWAASEPVIPPLALPPVKPLIGKSAPPPIQETHVTPFQKPRKRA